MAILPLFLSSSLSGQIPGADPDPGKNGFFSPEKKVPDKGIKTGERITSASSLADLVLDHAASVEYVTREGNCLTSVPAAGHSAVGCLEWGLPDVRPSAGCSEIPCETTGEFPYYTSTCVWRAGTCRFSATSHDDTLARLYLRPVRGIKIPR
jgi:hypothetical protein